MDRTEAIEILYNEMPSCGEKVTYTESERCEAYTMALAALCEQEKSGWISVEEKLPDLIPCNAGTAYSDAVIVWTDGKKAMIAVWDGIDFLCAADYWEAWGENITHWMPLPTPPKEDSYFIDSEGLCCSPAESPNWTVTEPGDFCSYGERVDTAENSQATRKDGEE